MGQTFNQPCYLQGLLLRQSAQWRSWVSPAAREHQRALEALALQRRCPLIDLALGFAREQAYLETVVLGLYSAHELSELWIAWSATSPWRQGDWQRWALQDPDTLDLRLWPSR